MCMVDIKNPKILFKATNKYYFCKDYKEAFKSYHFVKTAIPKNGIKNSRPIIVFGCSFAEGIFLKDEHKVSSRLADETGRVVEQMIELSNDQQNEISNKLIYLKDHLNEIVEVIYFVPDTRKKGGSYQNKKGTLRIIDEFEKRIQFTDKSYIDISNIYQIRIDELDRKEDLL